MRSHNVYVFYSLLASLLFMSQGYYSTSAYILYKNSIYRFMCIIHITFVCRFRKKKKKNKYYTLKIYAVSERSIGTVMIIMLVTYTLCIYLIENAKEDRYL